MKLTKDQIEKVARTLSYNVMEEGLIDCMPMPDSCDALEKVYGQKNEYKVFADLAENDPGVVTNLVLSVFRVFAEQAFEDEELTDDDAICEFVDQQLKRYKAFTCIGKLEDYEHKDWVLAVAKETHCFKYDSQYYIVGVEPY